MASNRQKLLIGAAGLAAGGLVGVKSLVPNIRDDIKTARKVNDLVGTIKEAVLSGKFFVDIFEDQVAKNPRKTMIIFEDRYYSYGFVNDMANKIANIALTWNMKPGDIVATMMYNEPAHIWTILGLQKVGLAAAFINYNLTSTPLVHCITVSDAKVLIVGKDDSLLESLRNTQDQLPAGLTIYTNDRTQSELPSSFLSLQDAMLRTMSAQVSRSVRSTINPLSPMGYIFTSGTTGLPKPVIINQSKVLLYAKVYHSLINSRSEDIVYAVTPLYHLSCFMPLASIINSGGTILLGRKFSATRYWSDVCKHNVTILSYIGELFRYLLANPKSKLDGNHKVRVAIGNGLRQDMWAEFQRRFKIPSIVEFFGATEGTGALFNVTGKVGAVGRLSPFMGLLMTEGLGGHFIKYDTINDKAFRDKNGRCVEIKPGQEGLMISPLPATYTGLYHGDPEKTEKKILRDVFQTGDAYFSFGDILYLDKDYYVYFRDRVGDTFRWKGENVSTCEVSNIISSLDFINDVDVYGVKVPNTEGRAGMAAIVLNGSVAITQKILHSIYKKCEQELPAYAQPLFLRFTKELAVTQTMKHRKIDLVKEGFDPRKTSDPLFVMDKINKTYKPLDTTEAYQTVLTSKL